MDLTKLSTSDLEALRDGDLSRVSTEGLTYMKQAATPAAAPKQPSLVESLKNEAVASVPGRFLRGMRDTVDAGAQLVTRGGEAATKGMAALGIPGMAGASEFMGQEADRVQRINNLDEQEYQEARTATGSTGVDLARAGGWAVLPGAAFGNAARAPTLAGKVMQGAKIGGTQAALQPVMGDDSDFWLTKAKQVGVGAAAGGVAGPIADKLGGWAAGKVNSGLSRGKAAVQTVAGKIPTRQAIEADVSDSLRRQGIDFYSDLTAGARKQMVDKAHEALKVGGNLDVGAMSRKADFDALEIPPMLGQLTRKPDQFTWEVNKRAAVPELATRMNVQNQRMVDVLDTMRTTAGPKVDAYSAGQTVSKALKAHDADLSKGVSEAYTAFRNSTGARADVPMAPMARVSGEVLDTFGKENIPGAVLSKLKGFGFFGSKPMKAFDVLEADKLLKVINANYDPMNKPQAAALDALRRGLKESIDLTPVPEGEASGALLKTALQKASQRFQLLDDVPALKAASLDDITPEKFVQQYLQRGGVDEATKMVKLLGPEEIGVLRGQVMETIRRKAVSRAANSEFAQFSQAGFRDALDDIGERKLRLLFDAQEIAQMRRLGRVASSIQVQPKGSWVNNSNTAVEGLGVLANAAGMGHPLLGAAASLPRAMGDANRASQALSGLLNPVSPTEFVSPLLASRFGGLLGPGLAAGGLAATQGRGN